MQAGNVWPLCSSSADTKNTILTRIGGESQHIYRLWKATPTNIMLEIKDDNNSAHDSIRSIIQGRLLLFRYHHPYTTYMPFSVVHQDRHVHTLNLQLTTPQPGPKDLPLPPNVCPQPVLAFWGINMPNVCLIPNIPHRFLIAPMWICGMHGHQCKAMVSNRCSLFTGIQMWKNKDYAEIGSSLMIDDHDCRSAKAAPDKTLSLQSPSAH